ncbi:hypothetical protein LTR70_006739 [Exophiala xenobiotica]|uniref:Uncharacterized protein n=1 Tax=Lithohypha guttulata TaxID=1690604 RepID=A0ABR0KA97_9EURO|nr:hypothetical protein LTR24_005005 [Lithohypha guttulata]KAK5315400.1 hypothetical protein LTR70_006739 [Exophiala xenobiotica]
MDLAGPVPELQGSNDDNTAQELYLEGFTKLGDQIFYFKPSQQIEVPSSGDIAPPDLTILCSWLYALPKHISKYTSAYQRIYPSTPILLLKQDGPDLMWRPNIWQMENLKPALDVLKDLQEAQGRRLRTLVHVFSNGGSFTACQLADAYALSARAKYKHSGWLAGPVTKLPISALIIDSAPSTPDMRTGFVALSQGLPSSLPGPVRLVGGAVMYTFMISGNIVGTLLGVEGAITGMRRKLNDAQGAFMANGVRRMYIYSESDELVPWEHVEMHAKEARNVLDKRGRGSGEEWLKMEKFVGSRHVGHVVVNAERYWRIVKAHWAEAWAMA